MSSPVRAAVVPRPRPRAGPPRRPARRRGRGHPARRAAATGPGATGRTGDCTRLRAKYRRGESLRATYRVGPDGDGRLVSARMFPAAKAATQFLRARDVAAGQGADPRSVLFDEETSTVFWVFPQDRKLVGLGRLTDPPPELRDVFGAPWTQSELMAYTPEKAATVRCTDAGRRDGRLREAAGRGRRPPQRRHPARRAPRHRRARQPAAAGRGRVPARAAPGAVLPGARSPAPPARPEPPYPQP